MKYRQNKSKEKRNEIEKGSQKEMNAERTEKKKKVGKEG